MNVYNNYFNSGNYNFFKKKKKKKILLNLFIDIYF